MSHLATRFLSVILIVGPVAACGAADGSAPGGVDQDNQAASVSVPAWAKVGDLLVYQTPRGDASSTYVISARFGDPAVATTDEPTRISDACELRVIPPGAAGPAALTRLPHAGRLSVASGRHSETIDPDGRGAYAVSGLVRNHASLWTGSDPLSISASGDTVPAFRISAPPPATLRLTVAGWPVLPPAADGPAPALDRASATGFSWEPADAGVVHVQLGVGELVAPGQDPQPVRVLECTWPAADGYGEVPADALAAQPSGEATIRGYLSTSGHATAGEFDITLTLVQDATLAGVDAALPIVALR